jgi:hypothetical protein
MAPRRFPPPWTVEEEQTWFAVRDHDGQQLASCSSPHFFLGCGPVALSSPRMTLDHAPSQQTGGTSMWNERKMPERWYGLLRERMQVEEQRMRVIRDGSIVEHDDLKDLLAQADSLDREMLLVMRQAIAAALVREAA